MYPDTNHTNEAIPSKTHIEFFAFNRIRHFIARLVLSGIQMMGACQVQKRETIDSIETHTRIFHEQPILYFS